MFAAGSTVHFQACAILRYLLSCTELMMPSFVSRRHTKAGLSRARSPVLNLIAMPSRTSIANTSMLKLGGQQDCALCTLSGSFSSPSSATTHDKERTSTQLTNVIGVIHGKSFFASEQLECEPGARASLSRRHSEPSMAAAASKKGLSPEQVESATEAPPSLPRHRSTTSLAVLASKKWSSPCRPFSVLSLDSINSRETISPRAKSAALSPRPQPSSGSSASTTRTLVRNRTEPSLAALQSPPESSGSPVLASTARTLVRNRTEPNLTALQTPSKPTVDRNFFKTLSQQIKQTRQKMSAQLD